MIKVTLIVLGLIFTCISCSEVGSKESTETKEYVPIVDINNPNAVLAVPLVEFSFEDRVVLSIDPEGIVYKDIRAKDAGEAYQAWMDAMEELNTLWGCDKESEEGEEK